MLNLYLHQLRSREVYSLKDRINHIQLQEKYITNFKKYISILQLIVLLYFMSTFLICSSLSYFFSFWFWFCFCFCFWFFFFFWFHLSAGLRHFYQIFTRMRRVTLPHDYVISAHCDASAPVIIFSRTMNTSLISLWKINKTFSVNEI